MFSFLVSGGSLAGHYEEAYGSHGSGFNRIHAPGLPRILAQTGREGQGLEAAVLRSQRRVSLPLHRPGCAGRER